MLERLRQRMDERGVALPFVAIMLVLLLGMTAFAVDLGWLYLNGSRVQRAADAAALAGVVHLPMDLDEVSEQAVNGANANGWDIGTVNGNPVTGGGPDELVWQSLADNRLQVDVTATVPTFFLKVLGMNDVTISRRATAEYVKPVPIGSPFSSFGDGTDTAQSFWAAVSGPYTALANGDFYQSVCDWAPSIGTCVDSDATNATLFGPNPRPWNASGQPRPNPAIWPNDYDPDDSATNPRYRPEGYYYGIEIAEGTATLTIELYDPGFRRRPVGGTGNDRFNCNMSLETGDCDLLAWGPSMNPLSHAVTQGPRTHFQLYAPDSTPLDPSDNPAVSSCGATYGAVAPSAPRPSWLNNWVQLCSSFVPEPGIYVLRVWTSSGSGTNQYGIRATTNGPAAKVYGINDISIFANANNVNLYLAEIDPVHAGKTLQLSFYDAGEGTNNGFMTVRMPNNDPATCTWVARDRSGGQIASQSSPGECRIQTTASGAPLYNNAWIHVEIDIPENYSCNINTQLGCWWKMHMQLNASHDRTTWTARIVGNPVRLVPNN